MDFVSARANDLKIRIRRLRRNNFHDYSFDDWEETTPLLYFDDNTTNYTTNESNGTEYTTTTAESESMYAIPTTTTLSGPMESVVPSINSTTDTTISTKVFNNDTEVTSQLVTEPDTTSLTNPFIDTRSIEATTNNMTTTQSNATTASYEIIETSEPIVDVPSTSSTVTEDILEYYVTTSTTSPLVTEGPVANGSRTDSSTISPFLLEMEKQVELHRVGFFTASMCTFLRVLALKDISVFDDLKSSFYEIVMEAQREGRLEMFGAIGAGLVVDLTARGNTIDTEILKDLAAQYYPIMLDRKMQFRPEANAMFDIADNVYTIEDAKRVADSIAEVDAYPNTTRSAIDIVKKYLLVAILVPFNRMRGTTREKLFMMEMENFIANWLRRSGRRHKRLGNAAIGFTRVKRNNFHDYNFDDWEETTPLLYFDDTSPTVHNENTTVDNATTINIATESENSLNVSEVTHSEITLSDITNATKPMNDETIQLTTKVSNEIVTVVDNATTVDVKEAIVSRIETTEIDVTTNYSITDNLEDLTPTDATILITKEAKYTDAPSHTSAAPTLNPLTLEVQKAMENNKIGYFTALLATLMRVTASKEDSDLDALKRALFHEVLNALNLGQLSMFGPVTTSALTDLSEMWSLLYADVLKSQVTYFYGTLLNRREYYNPDTNAIFDLIDNEYTVEDTTSILSCISDIEAFPNVSQSDKDISKHLLLVAFFLPYHRIRGTTKEKVLMAEIENLVARKIAGARRYRGTLRKPKYNRKNMKHKERKTRIKSEKQKTSILTSKNNAGLKYQFKPIRFYKDPVRLFDFWTSPTTTVSTTDVDLDYLRNKTIMKKLKRQMKAYKKKWKEIKEKEKIAGKKRGKTTTTTTTTVRPPLHKSKYYLRKYVKKDLYKMKTTTPSTTTKTKWFRKSKYKSDTDSDGDKNDDIDNRQQETDTDNKQNDIFYNLSNIDDKTVESYGSNVKETTERSYSKIRVSYKVNTKNSGEDTSHSCSYEYASIDKSGQDFIDATIESHPYAFKGGLNKNDTKYSKKRKRVKESVNSAFKINTKEKTALKKINELRRDSDYSNYEAELKMNIQDALIHGRENDLSLYKDKRRLNRIGSFPSYSNEETVIKANVYKAFGYTNDFAGTLKKLLNMDYTSSGITLAIYSK
ncbi:unnamed protein product [Leptosia nina]|uniref:Uncharacterized protein n=1 Tax=Leptosia nina TaxID=320188 RepID=A0AAV1JZM5_9NEOP